MHIYGNGTLIRISVGADYKRHWCVNLLFMIRSADSSQNEANSVYIAGNIREQDWYGPQGMEHVRTVKLPPQSIPTFAETIALLMLVRHSSGYSFPHAESFIDSPKISMSNSTSTSKCKMTPTVSFLSCTLSFPRSPIGRRLLPLGYYWGCGILPFYPSRKPDSLIAVVPISAEICTSRVRTSGRIVIRSASTLAH